MLSRLVGFHCVRSGSSEGNNEKCVYITHTHTLICAGLPGKLLNFSKEFAINFVIEHFETKRPVEF